MRFFCNRLFRMQLIDIGANLTHESFDSDRETVIESARAEGVVQMVITGASETGSIKATEVALAYPGQLFATAGVHPHRASDYNPEVGALFRQLLDKPEVVAVGETGLDYFRDLSPRDIQQQAFESHIEMAIETGLPMFLHQREAHTDFLAILKQHRDDLSDVVVHCFTDTHQALHDYLDLDCYIGITGWLCDERRGKHLKDSVIDIPKDRLLIETDSPYLKPRSMRPRVATHRNEPKWLLWIVGELAACRNETPIQTAEITTANARRFFRLPALA